MYVSSLTITELQNRITQVWNEIAELWRIMCISLENAFIKIWNCRFSKNIAATVYCRMMNWYRYESAELQRLLLHVCSIGRWIHTDLKLQNFKEPFIACVLHLKWTHLYMKLQNSKEPFIACVLHLKWTNLHKKLQNSKEPFIACVLYRTMNPFTYVI